MESRDCEFCLKPGGRICPIGYCHRHDARLEEPIIIHPVDVICARCGALDKLRIEVRGHANIVATCEGCGK